MAQERVHGSVVRWTDGGWRAHGLFAMLTAFFCLSLILHPTDVPVGPPLGDTMTTQWNFWWVDQVVSRKVASGDGLARTHALFAPLGTSLSYHTMEYTYAFLLWPVRKIAGGFAQQAAALIVATYLMAWFSWLAARQWGATRGGAAICSAVLTVHGYRLAEGIHLNIFSTFFLPLTMYALRRMEYESSRWKCALLLGAAGNAALATSLFHALECLLFGGFYFACRFFAMDRERRIRSTIQCACAGVLTVPLIVWIAVAMAASPAPPKFDIAAQGAHSADVWQFLIHPRLRMLLTGVESDWLSIVTNGQQRVWTWYLPGYFVLLAGGFFAVQLRRLKLAASGESLLLIGCLVFWVLALGPTLKLGSPREIDPEQLAVWMPARLVTLLPGLSTMRSLWHFGFSGTICLTVWCALWMGRGMARLDDARRRRLVQALAIVLATGESFVGGIGSFANRMDGAGKFLASIKDHSGAVAIFPQYFYQYRGHFMYHQTMHGKPILGGYISRDPQDFEAWKKEHRWPIELEELGYGKLKMLDETAARALLADVTNIPISNVEIYDDTESRLFSEKIAAELNRVVGGEVVYRDETSVVVDLSGKKATE